MVAMETTLRAIKQNIPTVPVVILTHSKSGTVHSLTGDITDNPLVIGVFKAVANFSSGDTFSFNGTTFESNTESGDVLPNMAFKQGSTVMMTMNLSDHQLSFKSGGLGGYNVGDTISADNFNVKFAPISKTKMTEQTGLLPAPLLPSLTMSMFAIGNAIGSDSYVVNSNAVILTDSNANNIAVVNHNSMWVMTGCLRYKPKVVTSLTNTEIGFNLVPCVICGSNDSLIYQLRFITMGYGGYIQIYNWSLEPQANLPLNYGGYEELCVAMDPASSMTEATFYVADNTGRSTIIVDIANDTHSEIDVTTWDTTATPLGMSPDGTFYTGEIEEIFPNVKIYIDYYAKYDEKNQEFPHDRVLVATFPIKDTINNYAIHREYTPQNNGTGIVFSITYDVESTVDGSTVKYKKFGVIKSIDDMYIGSVAGENLHTVTVLSHGVIAAEQLNMSWLVGYENPETSTQIDVISQIGDLGEFLPIHDDVIYSVIPPTQMSGGAMVLIHCGIDSIEIVS